MNRVARRLRLRARLTLAALSASAICLGMSLAASEAKLEVPVLLIAVGLYAFLCLISTFLQKPYCVVHPYFSKKLSTERPSTAFQGEAIAAHLDEIDTYLHEHGFKSISDFGYQQTKIRRMHHPDELLRSLMFLVQNDSLVHSELRTELLQWIEKISIARDDGASVAIHMRIADGVSGLEMDRLPGTY